MLTSEFRRARRLQPREEVDMQIRLLVVLMMFGCGSSYSGAGVATTVGGPAGTVCYPTTHQQGCSANQRMICDAVSSTWTVLELCVAGSTCITQADPSDSSGGKMLATCVAGGGSASGGNTGGGNTSQSWMACLEQKCSTQLQSCSAQPDCAKSVACASVCGADSACSQACFDSTPRGAQSALVAVFMCAEQMKCEAASGSNLPSQGCGDGICSMSEDATTCPADCKEIQNPCGNGTCDVGETPQSCPADCKDTSDPCGNGTCDIGETPQSCPADCKPNPNPCGNGTCDIGETAQNCPVDCKPSEPACGNGTCEVGENAQSCPQDCSSQGGGSSCVEQQCGNELSACGANPSCVAIVYYGALAGCGEDNQCQDMTCIQSQCGQEYSACMGIPQCSTIMSCLGNATTEQAAQACLGSGFSLYEAVAQCAQTKCPNG